MLLTGLVWFHSKLLIQRAMSIRPFATFVTNFMQYSQYGIDKRRPDRLGK